MLFDWPHNWRGLVFFVCIPTGCAVMLALYLWKASTRGEGGQIARPSLQYTAGAVIAIGVLLELALGNYAISKMFSPNPYWLYSVSFSLVPIVSGCLAWNVWVRTSLYMPAILAAVVPAAVYGALFFCGAIAHLVLFYYSGGH